jgi:transcriptional regulator with XRE-family HTH domain
LPGVRISLKCPKPKKNFPTPQTVGEHIKARRLAFGLFQKDAARTLGVNQWTLINWEKNRTEPPASAYPAIHAFLGYDPLPEPQSLPERLKAKRRELGWSIREAARQFGVDQTAWGSWEHGGIIMYREHRTRIAKFLGLDESALMDDMARAWGEKHM